MKKQYILRGFLTLAILLCFQALAGAQTTGTGELAFVGEDVVPRWGGIHFTFDNVAGQSIGRNVGTYVFQNLMRPRQCVQ